MSLASWLLSKVNSIIGRNPSVYRSTNMREMNAMPPVYPDSNVETFINQGYCGNDAVFSIISLAARRFSNIPWFVYKVKNEKASKQYKSFGDGMAFPGAVQKAKFLHTKAYEETVTDNDLAILLSRPNPNQGQDAFLEAVYSFKLLTGEAFIWLNRGDLLDRDGNYIGDDAADKMPVLEMYVLPTQTVDIIPDRDDVWGILRYEFTVNGEKIPIRKNDIIHWKSFNPKFDGTTRVHLRGFAPLDAGKKKLTQHDDSTDAMVSMYQNGGAKGVAYEKSLRSITLKQEEQLDSVFERKINNKAVKAAVARVQGDWGYLKIGDDSVDMELLKGNEQAKKDLANLIGVPPELFIEGQTYENKNQARKDLLTNLIIPALCSLRDEMNRQLLPAFGITGETIDVDYSGCPELQQEMSAMVAALKDAWWYTPNERRQLMNEEPGDNPLLDEYWIPNNLTLINDAATNMDKLVNDLADQGMNDYGAVSSKNGKQVA